MFAHSNGMWPFAFGNPDVASVMHPMPLVVWFRPVMRQERVGEQSAVVWKFVYVSPRSAIRLMFGVSTSPPYGSIAEKPTSSRTTYSTLGAPSGAIGWVNGSQSGTESLMSMSIFPRNGWLTANRLLSRIALHRRRQPARPALPGQRP